AAQEVALAEGHGGAQIGDERGLARARVPGHEQHLPTTGDHTLERRVHELPLCGAPIEMRRDVELLAVVPSPQHEALDGPGSLELAQTLVEVGATAPRALVAVFGHLGHELADDVRDRG